ncbi:glycosyltransferase [Conexibacter arvalis]|uniref:Glycosyltransferase involved in cell wall biosynthesis n=1 Tax=Conexibacter arvalis TaxID=912552 RepID=A0A840IEM9_9ACTN|nr:glycosyltransferase [Conexibacter arvalis]MBB4662458.1 glycosyltransferase involved in cell wall biosynthesis [Conexibacter arvalis]
MRLLLFHGYLLGGTGSNVYNAELAAALVRLGHVVDLVCQDRDPARLPFVDAVGDWDAGELRVRTLREPVRCAVYRPALPGGILPVYVADRYEAVEARPYPQLTDAELAAYVEGNVAAVREVVARAAPDAALANHLVMGPLIVRRALGATPYAVKIHGSALEYTVARHPERFLAPAREGIAGARGVLVGSRHTAERLWATVEEPGLPERTRLGPPGVDVARFAPRPPTEARAGLARLAGALAEAAAAAASAGALPDGVIADPAAAGAPGEPLSDGARPAPPAAKPTPAHAPDDDAPRAGPPPAPAPDDDAPRAGPPPAPAPDTETTPGPAAAPAPPSSFDRDADEAARALERLVEAPAEDPLVAYVGKLIVSKGVDLLLAAWPLVLAEQPRARLAVVGFGAYRPALERLLAALAVGDLDAVGALAAEGRAAEGGPAGRPLAHLRAFLDRLAAGGELRERYLAAAVTLPERVVLTGRLEHDELADLLPACAAQVVPSTFPEAFGMVAAEAAACGALPVCAAHSGLAEVAGALAAAVPAEAHGWLAFPVGDGAVEAIAARVTGWLGAPAALRERTRAALVATARERWSWEGVARGVIAAAEGRLETLPAPVRTSAR